MLGGGGREGNQSCPGTWRPWLCLPVHPRGSPQLACSAALLAHPVHLEDHWIGNNTLPASALSSLQGHIWSPRLTLSKGRSQPGRWKGAWLQSRSKKAIKELVSELEPGRWGQAGAGPAGWGDGGREGPNLLTPKQQPAPGSVKVNGADASERLRDRREGEGD